MRVKSLMAAGMGLLLAAGAANAATVSFSDSFGPATTNWSHNLSVTRFDPALGTLNSVKIDLLGDVNGDVNLESLDGAPATVTGNVQAQITVTAPDSTVLATVLPLASTMFNASAFDGTADFGGTSGTSITGLTNSDSTSQTFTSPSVLAQFIGLGSVALPGTATGQSNASGAGNLLTQFSTNAGALVKVTYDYTPGTAVPVPAAAWGGLMLLGGLGVRRMRRAARA